MEAAERSSTGDDSPFPAFFETIFRSMRVRVRDGIAKRPNTK